MPSPIHPTDDAARTLARSLIDGASFGALAVVLESGTPFVSRIAIGTAPDGTPLSLISTLATHTGALHANPACALLLGEPTRKGDPLTHPRITLECQAEFVALDDPARPMLRDHYLATHPKSKLYIDFADFSFVRFRPHAASLNGGFGKAYRLRAADLTR
jgi:hypothetical protein